MASTAPKSATEKADAQHNDFVETPLKQQEIIEDAVARGQITSGYETLGWWHTVAKFKFVSFVCFLAAFSAATDGFQVAMSASIIANKGFVAEFGTKVNADGDRYLDSPAWLANMGREEKAKKIRTWLHRGVEGYDVDHQYHLLELNIEDEKALAVEQRKEHWAAIFRGVDGRRTLTALWTISAQQFTGLALFGTFGTCFFQQAGLKGPFAIKAITTSLQIVTVVAAVFLVDKLVVGILGTAPRVGATTYISIVFACFWNIGISANGAAGWGFIGEISSQRLRPHTSGFAASAKSLGGLSMSILMPYMVNSNEWNWGLKTGWFYGVVGLPFVIGIWFLIPETAGRSATELDELFERKIKPWRFHRTETATERLVKAERQE
ncbi:hypothetical protein FOVG_17761 [Fusarium oxysporum f. sp. pisi HDV247]|uniref:Major facilitator superfamily (MFS) profile domain-containing protein n=1 Tax=Fusarium oxysporum f. sp. pisi HDV247 TaxID=1080344 RepID=W9NDY5_FUSOX|nr:hypothetical protein FOVG_17761 [Fusarium oxysporum f. sp. pisi HDV247]